ncbi:MAG: DUF1826 domain-containing protein [Calothrix sp. SM1_5_4]|nr:DUF1826 domain-containing protein [Calothrix sp. SM1_5_4]
MREFTKALPKRFAASRKFWTGYIRAINQAFCRSFGTRRSLLRFSQVSHDQCRLFHSDNVHVRLFQTIEGPGTEYLLEDNVDRSGLGGGCNGKIVIDPARVQHARTKTSCSCAETNGSTGRALSTAPRP